MVDRRPIVLVTVMLLAAIAGLSPRLLFGDSNQERAKQLIGSACIQCHRFQGAPDSRFNLKAPDLIWAGSKYQRTWLVDWLTGREAGLYAKGYRWDEMPEPSKHLAVSDADAVDLADYFEQHYKDPRVTVGAFDSSKITKLEVEFGRQAYKAHACIGCHQIEEGRTIVGGPQSTSLVTAGRRYNPDWLYRFGQNPQDFTPHSGEFLADATDPQLRAVIGYLVVQGTQDFHYYEPWTSPEFGLASVERGKRLYREYCSQCHGATGKGDGPAASGLEPKPAIHANIPFEKLPMEYLYNVIYHGGRAVGKSPTMPYWGLTFGQQGVADVIAYLKATFKGAPQMVQASGDGQGSLGICPQQRKTVKAPEEFLQKVNPLPSTAAVINSGKALFQQSAQPMACAMCHGNMGDGQGFMGAALNPPPRNFTCGKMMNDIQDGQLFWIIKNGSPGTGMLSFAGLPDDQVWQLIHYIRSLNR